MTTLELPHPGIDDIDGIVDRLADLGAELACRRTRLVDELVRLTSEPVGGERGQTSIAADDEIRRTQLWTEVLDNDRRLLEATLAWRRLARGRYGRCSRCHRAIGADRMAVSPTADRCTGCLPWTVPPHPPRTSPWC